MTRRLPKVKISGRRQGKTVAGKIEGVDLMNKTTVVIMGKGITIHYALHDPSYVEWNMVAPVEGLEGEMELLNVLLRTHYSDFIESACREAYFYDSYAASAAADDWMDTLRYTQGIRKGLFNPDDEEDIPF